MGVTTVGIVFFVLDSHPRALNKLLMMAKEEMVDGKDVATAEPVLAESGFTVVHLLEHMELWTPRKYYGGLGMYRIRHEANLPMKKVGLEWTIHSRVRAKIEAMERDVFGTAGDGGKDDLSDTAGLSDVDEKAEVDIEMETKATLVSLELEEKEEELTEEPEAEEKKLPLGSHEGQKALWKLPKELGAGCMN